MDSKAEQYYPTYTFKPENRDVVLLEFEEAQKIANGQTKVYGQVTNILLAVVTVLIPLFFNKEKDSSDTFTLIKENALFFSSIIFIFGALILRYFVDLQKSITINARKVVTLRTMLGLDYGHIHLTLPNWRVEGATNPFTIKYFNGWLMFQSMPFWVLTIGVNAIWWLTTNSRIEYNFDFLNDGTRHIPWYLGNIIITLTYLLIFRRNLNDIHETSFLNIVRLFAKIIRFRLLDNFEYVLYRAKLSITEMNRLNVNYVNLKSILIEIEDKTFYENKGISFKSLFRAFISQIRPIRERLNLLESGGSTITMQLSRTLFIPPNQNKYLRKLFEISISVWLQKQFSKQEILNLYIVSVRYDYGVMGLSKAIKHFYDNVNNKQLSLEESFVLVERLSNVTGTFRQERINFLIEKSTKKLDHIKVNDIYQTLIKKGKIKIK